MRKFLFIALFITVFAVAPLALAQTSQTSFVPLAPIPGLTERATADTAGLATFFNNLYKYLVGLSAVLAVIMIIWGGLQYSTQDSPGAKSDGKERIYQAIFGLVLVLSPVLVFSIINPSILNLSIDFDPLKTASGTNNGGGTGAGTAFCSGQTTTNCTPLPPSDDCSVVAGQEGFLQKALCSTDAAANKWAAKCPWRVSGRKETCLSRDSSGCIQKVITLYCENKIGPLVFVDIGERNSTDYHLQPLKAAAGSASFQPFNAGCGNSGGRVCTVGLKTSPSVNCNSYGGYTTPLPGNAAGKCYNVPVYCYSPEDADQANSYFHANPLNTTNYDVCAPVVKFTPQPLQ